MQGRGFSGTSTVLLGVNGKRMVCVLRALLLEMSIRYTAAPARDGELAIVIDGKGNWSMLLTTAIRVSATLVVAGLDKTRALPRTRLLVQ